jgi:hypothetical protein
MKKLILILMLSLLVLSVGSAWAVQDLMDAEIVAGLSVWNPSISFTPALTGITLSSSLLVGPKIFGRYQHFFGELSYLMPLSGFSTSVDVLGVTLTESIKTSWLNFIAGYMITPIVGIYGGYISNSTAITVSIGSLSASASAFSISGPGAGIIAKLPIGKLFNVYANGSYTLGSYKDDTSSVSCTVMNVDGGVGYKFLNGLAQVNAGWRYQTNSTSDTVSSAIKYSGPYGNVSYSFGSK